MTDFRDETRRVLIELKVETISPEFDSTTFLSEAGYGIVSYALKAAYAAGRKDEQKNVKTNVYLALVELSQQLDIEDWPR
jgi:hypothetical protein